MSSTRYAPDGSPLSQSRYMSSPEYAELRGVSGIAVTAKAGLLDTPDQRSLLYFLQALSLKEGGFKKLAKEIVSIYPERIGTPAMHQFGIRPNRIYSEKEALIIDKELGDNLAEDFSDLFEPEPKEHIDLRDFIDWEPEFNTPKAERKEHKSLYRTAKEYLSHCRNLALENLDSLLVDLCINPALELPDSEDTGALSVNYFKNILGALYDYQRRYEEKSRSAIAKTSISEQVFATLDKCLETRKMVVIQGNSRLGKSTGTEAWCNMHLGEVRYVSLSGIMNRTSFFRALARALGLACSYTRKSNEMQFRVEDMLQRSGLMLVIDEAHYLFPQQKRVYVAPELVDWINTALCNYKVPVALVCTPQFAQCRSNVEKQTGWNSEQLRGRINQYQCLPEVPTLADLEAVAKINLPKADKASIQLLVGYAKTSSRYLPAIVDTIDEARLIARHAGREDVRFEDIDQAISQYRIPSDQAQASAFEDQAARSGRRRSRQAPPASVTAQAEVSPEEAHETPSRNRLNTLPDRLAPLPAARPPSTPAIPDPERPRITQEAVLQD